MIKIKGDIETLGTFIAERGHSHWHVLFRGGIDMCPGEVCSGQFTDAEFGAFMALLVGYGEDVNRDAHITEALYALVQPKIAGWAIKPIP